MKRFMVDIEGLGKMPGGVILSIGWVRFNLIEGPEMETRQERRLNIQWQIKHGLKVDGETIDWWLHQPGMPWEDGQEAVDPYWAITDLFADLARADEVWAKPPSYDLSAIKHLAAATDTQMQPWHFRAESCFRTLKRLTPKGVDLPEMTGVKHGALADAIQQAKEAAVILKALKAPAPLQTRAE